MAAKMNTERLAWVDLETTGLVPEQGVIVELGIVVTTTDLEIVAAQSWLVGSLEDAFPRASEYVQRMHEKNGLWLELGEHGRPIEAVRGEALAFMREHAPHAPMAGFTISFDRGWLQRHMFELQEQGFHYRNFDARSLIIAAEMWTPWRETKGGEPAHRSIPDCLEAIAKAAELREILKRAYP